MTVPTSPLVTDLYQLSMMQGYLYEGIAHRRACFDMFFRKHPFGGGYTIAAGQLEVLRFLANMHFKQEELDYLLSLGIYSNDFINHLADMRFDGDVFALPEGSLAFPLEPIVRVEAPLDQCQLIETLLLNTINFQSLITTKAARVCREAGTGDVLEFGLRRAQGQDGGLSASRAAYLGGCVATSNVRAGQYYGIPVAGTNAHSWVLAFPTELESFRAFARCYPLSTILLVDTFDTLKSGVPNAITVGLEMQERGEKLIGIRLDSGDLAFLSVESRRMLDAAGLDEVKIVCSGDLDEYIIRDLNQQGAAIDIYGVGTRLVSAQDDPSLSGVYKLAALQNELGAWESRLKITDGGAKASLPGIKELWRLSDSLGNYIGDYIERQGYKPDFANKIYGYDPLDISEKHPLDDVAEAEQVLVQVMKDGKIIIDLPPLQQLRKTVSEQLSRLPSRMSRIMNPHLYRVIIGSKLRDEILTIRESLGE